MKLIIAGSRDIHLTEETIKELMEVSGLDYRDITEVVSGRCRGMDLCGEEFAEYIQVPVQPFPYKKELGKAGGPVRNREMAEYADALFIVHNGGNGSTSMMREMAKYLKKPIYEIKLKNYKGIK